MEEESPQLTFCGKDISPYDVIIPRIGASITAFGTAVVRHFEQMGDLFVQSLARHQCFAGQARAFQALSRHDIGMPETAFVKRKQDVLPAIERVGGAPVIIKLLEGTQGVGVILADSVPVAAAIIETLSSTQHNVLIQKFVKESKGKDIRAFVIGDRVVAAMRRQAVGQEFRSNVHRGGKAMRGRSASRIRTHRRTRGPHSGTAGWRAWICSKAISARRSWKSTPRRGWKASKKPPAWTSPARSSNTWKIRSRLRMWIFGIGCRWRGAIRSRNSR